MAAWSPKRANTRMKNPTFKHAEFDAMPSMKMSLEIDFRGVHELSA